MLYAYDNKLTYLIQNNTFLIIFGIENISLVLLNFQFLNRISYYY